MMDEENTDTLQAAYMRGRKACDRLRKIEALILLGFGVFCGVVVTALITWLRMH